MKVVKVGIPVLVCWAKAPSNTAEYIIIIQVISISIE